MGGRSLPIYLFIVLSMRIWPKVERGHNIRGHFNSRTLLGAYSQKIVSCTFFGATRFGKSLVTFDNDALLAGLQLASPGFWSQHRTPAAGFILDSGDDISDLGWGLIGGRGKLHGGGMEYPAVLFATHS